MKKIIVCLLLMFLLCSCSVPKEQNENPLKSEENSVLNKSDYVKAIWITYYELENITENCNTSGEFKQQIKNVFSFLHKKGFNTVTVQIRPCADAFYNSKYFPVSRYCFGTEGAELIYDPLEIVCEVAHSENLKIEAWVNPYRVSQSNDINELCENNIAKKWYQEKSDNVYISKSKIYFNPAGKGVKKLIVNGIKEIVKNYDVDAIHFDDYFYPTTKKKIDKNEYKEYISSGGEKALSDWRREIVSDMVKSVYSAIKKINSNVLFGISPAAGMKNDYETLYADVYTWCSQKGYCDYICPQIYFGFQNDILPFMKTVKDWRDSTTVCKLYVGLPLYKCGKVDEYALRGKNEFKENNNIISRQIKYIEQIDEVSGFYIFSYNCLNDKALKNEVSLIYSEMQ